ncbi:hypothetical protein LTS18_013170 [Coniosporium uncinatum]|uniref:Uncharacterized protein n=1 Tax=Coniosporium uncinatum TaxID=93489 RepID=A0ACC3DII8_9PEZI|nr:hypothetical protein LTS18_013170 [Coniosporium uncinatum]
MGYTSTSPKRSSLRFRRQPRPLGRFLRTALLDRLQQALGEDPKDDIAFNFLFQGPPGTGKTTTARKMGRVFDDMGFLADAEVVDCSATDLIGQYVGHTGLKTQNLLEKSLGKVLFIDEAYRFAEEGFATEAMDELVDCLTKPKYRQKMVTILAGYDEDINRLMAVNPGLTSRFPETIVIKNLTAEQNANLVMTLLRKKSQLDPVVLEQCFVTCWQQLLEDFRKLASLPSWGEIFKPLSRISTDWFSSPLRSPKKALNCLWRRKTSCPPWNLW